MFSLEYISDIHLKRINFNWRNYLKDESDFLVLLGDIIDTDRLDILEKLFSDLKSESNYKKIFMIAGNHEYYSYLENNDYKNINKKIKILTKKYNIIFLDNKVYKFKDYVFIGSTLWSRAPSDELYRKMKIYNENEILTREKFNELNKKSLEFIFSNVEKYKNNKIILFTHYPPLFEEIMDSRLIKHKYRYMDGNKLNKDYFKFITLWFYGHIHRNYELDRYGTKFRNNQYADKDKFFIYGKNIELE